MTSAAMAAPPAPAPKRRDAGVAAFVVAGEEEFLAERVGVRQGAEPVGGSRACASSS